MPAGPQATRASVKWRSKFNVNALRRNEHSGRIGFIMDTRNLRYVKIGRAAIGANFWGPLQSALWQLVHSRWGHLLLGGLRLVGWRLGKRI